MYEQLDIFDLTLPKHKIDKPIRLIELFAGIGSQSMALRDLGADFEHYRISEWEVNANKSYKAIYMPDDNIDYSRKFEKFKWIARILYEYGISVDGKTRLSLKEVRNRGEKWVRQTYNEFRATHNFGSITNAHALDFRISDTDRYCYIMTYSFPCQDLSVAGKQRGMKKGSGTRSGLLWEVERLLNECQNLPQVLLMENVPQVHSQANMPDFQKWINFLASKGYSNYWQDLNAKDYGVAQNRNRCFMVSILGEWNYKFPQPIPLTKTMKDYLEDEVGEKYYISSEKAQKLIQQLVDNGTLAGADRYTTDFSLKEPRENEIANCIIAKYDNGIGNRKADGSCVVEKLRSTMQGEQRESKIIVAMRGRNPENLHDRTAGSPTEQRLEPNSQGTCNTLTSVQKDNLVLETGMEYRIRKLTPLECWRLMGFSDEDFCKAEKVNSNSQLYKQAGNSIVKPVLMAILGQMIPGKENVHNRKTMDSSSIKETICLNSKGGRAGTEGLQPSLQDRVYSTEGISTAITSSYMPNFLEEWR